MQQDVPVPERALEFIQQQQAAEAAAEQFKMASEREKRAKTSAIDGLVDERSPLCAQTTPRGSGQRGWRGRTVGAPRLQTQLSCHRARPPPIRCTGSDPYCTLLATGASACHMTRPDGCDEEDARIYPERCEFMACLPADWPAAAA